MFSINHSFFLFIMMEKGVYLSCQDEEKISIKEKTAAGKRVTKKVEPKRGQLSMDFCTERVTGKRRQKNFRHYRSRCQCKEARIILYFRYRS